MWRVNKAAGRPWPVLIPDDDVLDYMVMEAVAIKVQREDSKAQAAHERKQQQKAEEKRLREQYGK